MTKTLQPTGAEVLGYFETLSNWGRWGADDQRGTLNLITAPKVQAAAATVQQGLAISCSRRLDMDALDPISKPHRYFTTSGEGLADEDRIPHYAGAPARARWNCAQEYIGLIYHGAAPTHLDALSHMFWDGRMYNDRPAALVSSTMGATSNDVQACADGISTRGVLLDIPALHGVEWLEPGTGVGPDDLEAAERRQGVRVESGDAVLLRTGHVRRARAMFPDRYAEGDWSLTQAGWSASCLPWLHERGAALIGADNMQDQKPSGYEEQDLPVPVHAVGLVAMGLWLLDNCDLEQLAQACENASRWEFFLSITPLRMPGGTGSPVNPIAIL
ncbi:MAG TPA: cyclase family protein [Jatrophihabitans sp.]|nr:cyclase family protein [Jatrophihabitans sp.]